MKLTNFQQYMDKERWKIINKFQKNYRTIEEKEKALQNMQNKDINFLIYCSDNLQIFFIQSF